LKPSRAPNRLPEPYSLKSELAVAGRGDALQVRLRRRNEDRRRRRRVAVLELDRRPAVGDGRVAGGDLAGQPVLAEVGAGRAGGQQHGDWR
jgi:hypothetical protein